jgi:preprotein translocase subunit SecB
MSDQPQAQADDGRNFTIQRVYTKDVSFETPNSPSIFTEKWHPESNLELNSSVQPMENDLYEVTLSVTVTTKIGDKVAFLVEVKQAGVFLVRGFPQQELGPMMGAYCPNILFPYAREVVSDLVTKGSFPQLVLAPVNFELLYAQHLQEQAKKQKNAEATH